MIANFEPVEELLVEWERLRRRGLSVSAEELCCDAPHLLSSVRQGIAALEGTDWLFDTIGDSVFNEPVPKHPDKIGDYEIIDCLGAGGMGTVYKARHCKLDKLVALKILGSGRFASAHSAARFEREMRAIGKLEHPNIVTAYDAGEVDGTQYLAMQLIEGIDVAKALKQRRQLDVADACEIARQTALGLQYAHEHGLIHRDIKPSNLMLGKDGVVKLLDVGLARLTANSEAAEQLSHSGSILGTLDFMPPEQCDGSQPLDERADVYALGATLYKLLCGKAPLEQDRTATTLKKLQALASGDIPKLSTRGHFPAELTKLVDQMLSANPKDRGSATDIAARLAPFCQSSNLKALGRSVASRETTPIARMEGPPAICPSSTGPKSQTVRWLPAIALALCAIAFMAMAKVIRITTDRGTIVVNAGDGVTVEELEKAGVRLKHLRTGQTYRVLIGSTPQPSGEYLLEVQEGSGLSFSARHFSITRGETEELLVTLETRQDPVTSSSATAVRVRFRIPIIAGDGCDLQFTADGKFLLVSGLNVPVLVLDAATGKEVRRLDGFNGKSRAMVQLADGNSIISSDGTGRLLQHNFRTGELIREVSKITASARDLSLSPDEKLLASVTLGPASVCDVQSGLSHPIRLNGYQCGFNRDGKSIWFQVLDDGLARYDIATHKIDKPCPQFGGKNGFLAFHVPTNQGAYYMNDGTVALMDLSVGTVTRSFLAIPGKYLYAKFSHLGDRLVVGNRFAIGKQRQNALYDLRNGGHLLDLNVSGMRNLSAVCFSPDDKSLAISSLTDGVAVVELP